MKTKTVTIYSILWPHNEAPTYSFVEMKDMGCVTVGQQTVELLVHEMPGEADAYLRQAKVAALRLQKDKLEQELRSLENE